MATRVTLLSLAMTLTVTRALPGLRGIIAPAPYLMLGFCRRLQSLSVLDSTADAGPGLEELSHSCGEPPTQALVTRSSFPTARVAFYSSSNDLWRTVLVFGPQSCPRLERFRVRMPNTRPTPIGFLSLRGSVPSFLS